MVSADEVEALLAKLDHVSDGRAIAISHASRDDLNKYSILSVLSTEEKKAVVEKAATDNKLNRCMGSMVGMAVGDALGHPFEFMPTVDTPGPAHFDLAEMESGRSDGFFQESNAFRLQRGQWTDDASMGLCMADSLIMKRSFSGADMRVRFWCWWNRGYDNAFRNDPSRSGSVGLGGNISKSLMSMTYAKDKNAIPDKYEAQGEDAGNGSLMRYTPIAIYHHDAKKMLEVYECSRAASYTTHPGIIAAEACSLLGHLIVAAVNLPEGPVDPKKFLVDECARYMDMSGLAGKSGWGFDEMKWLVNGNPERATERCWRWKDDCLDIAGTLRARGSQYNGYPVSAGYFGSYSMDGLAMAMWCVYHTTSFDEAVVRSVNLLGDADSHGSICAQLAGALYGYSAINKQFITWLTKWDDHDFAVKAVMLHHLGATRGLGDSPPVGSHTSQPSIGRVVSEMPASQPSLSSLGRQGSS